MSKIFFLEFLILLKDDLIHILKKKEKFVSNKFKKVLKLKLKNKKF